ncbi:MAG: DUF4314 domain-containing protein [Fastidiosipilaceae bacterium]|jgi:hypothetical protein
MKPKQNKIKALSKSALRQLRQDYPMGARVKCLEMVDESIVRTGDLGNVITVDDIGQVHVLWDSGVKLALIPGLDRFNVED